MKKILITCALEKELQVAKKYFKATSISWCKISFLCLWIWTHKSILNLSLHLQEYNYDFIVNYGVCGYTKEKQDCIQIVRSYHMWSQKEILTPVFFSFAQLSSILCSDIPIDSDNHTLDMSYVDMESYGFEMVCEHKKIPRIILKVPVDKIWEETKNFNIPHACHLLEKNIDFSALMIKIKAYLDTLPIKPDLTQYTKYLWCTVSEEIIFYKYVQAFKSLSKESFEIFFNSHKHLTKKEFLKAFESHINYLKSLLW